MTVLILVKAVLNLGICLWFLRKGIYPLSFMFFGFVVADLGSYWVARSFA